MKLFAVLLGGRADRCNTELHDVVFTVAESIEAAYPAILRKWFGMPRGLHIDSWIDLAVVDGYRVRLASEPSPNEKRLYFVNLGGYLPGRFAELHENTFLVAENKVELVKRARAKIRSGLRSLHTDNLLDIDDCIPLEGVDGFHVVLESTDAPETLVPNNGYLIIPKLLVTQYEDELKSRSQIPLF